MKISVDELSSLLDCWSEDGELEVLPKRLQRACEVEFGRVLDGADVARQREALVVIEFDVAAVRLELADREG